MKVAVVHEWMVTYAGSERVVEHILQEFPEADLYVVCDFLAEADRGFLGGKRPRTSFIQRLPGAARHYQKYLPLMPLAVEQFDLRGYDLVISSSHAVAKGVITGPDQLHISYVHSPMRYAWDLQHQYLQEAGLARGLKSGLARLLLHYMRLWDARTANGVDHFVANSSFIARRIRKVYRREAEVIYPPVDLSRFVMGGAKEDFYLTASRMVPYKKVPTIVEAFSRMPGKRLVVIGDGPDFTKARAAATPNVTLLGYQPGDVLLDHMQRARAFVFAAEEDFGITSVEAQACGTPVIAFGRGGSLETVIGDPGRADATGVYFAEQSADAIVSAVTSFERQLAIDGRACRTHAERFGAAAFRKQFRACVEARMGVASRAATGTGERSPPGPPPGRVQLASVTNTGPSLSERVTEAAPGAVLKGTAEPSQR